MDNPTSGDLIPKRDHDKDLELDKKIEALRRKNAALMKRYKEVEEDRKKAEEEGMALQCRKGKADDLSVTISKAISDSRVVITKPLNSVSDQAGEGPSQGVGREQRTQLTVTMSAKKGKRVVSEKSPGHVDSKRDEGQPRHVESARVKQPARVTKTDTTAQEEVKQNKEQNEEHQQLSEDLQSLLGSTDLNIPTSKEEQGEYLRWKKEREQIDRERVARHKNAKGQWRRAWDMDKSENMWPKLKKKSKQNKFRFTRSREARQNEGLKECASAGQQSKRERSTDWQGQEMGIKCRWNFTGT